MDPMDHYGAGLCGKIYDDKIVLEIKKTSCKNLGKLGFFRRAAKFVIINSLNGLHEWC